MPEAQKHSQPKRHHVIPEMLQKRFVDTDGLLYFYDKRRESEGVQKTSKENLFVHTHIYSTIEEDGTRNAKQEMEFADLEGRANWLLEKIVDGARRNETPDLSDEERALANEFLMFQMKRVPDFFNQVSVDAIGQIEAYLAEVETAGGHIPEEEKASVRDPAFVKRATQNGRVTSVARRFERILDAFASKGLAVARIPEGEGSFVLGSHPTARLVTPEGRSDLRHPHVELWLPIAKDVAITPSGEPGTERLFRLGAEAITKINRMIFHQSTVVASGSREFLESLIRA